MTDNKMIITKDYFYAGTCLRGREVTVITKKIKPDNIVAYKIRLFDRPGIIFEFWVHSRDSNLLVPSNPLSKSMFS